MQDWGGSGIVEEKSAFSQSQYSLGSQGAGHPSLQLHLLLHALPAPALQLVRGVLGDILDEVVELPATVVVGDLLGALGQPEEGGEALHLELGRHVVSGGVHLDDLHILGGHLLAQLVKDGSQLLAVAAPKHRG